MWLLWYAKGYQLTSALFPVHPDNQVEVPGFLGKHRHLVQLVSDLRNKQRKQIKENK